MHGAGWGTLVVHERFDPAAFIATAARERITHTAMVPIQFQRVIEHLQRQGGDVSSLQAMMSCGSPLREGLKPDIFRYFPCGIIELYGLTEGIITTLDPAIATPLAAAEDTAVPPDLWPVFAAIAGLPILVLRGMYSDILSPAGIAAMRARKPDLVVALIADRGHAATLDEPAARAAIEEFLARFA